MGDKEWEGRKTKRWGLVTDQDPGRGERSLGGRGDHRNKEGGVERLHTAPSPSPSLQQWLRKKEGRQERRQRQQ